MIVCRLLSHHESTVYLKDKNLIRLGYSGLYMNTSNQNLPSYIDYLMDSVINNPLNLSLWEEKITFITKQSLHRLIFEGDFSFSDKINS